MNTRFVSSDSTSLRELISSAEILQYGELLNHAFMGQLHYPFFDDFPVWDPKWGASGVHRYGIFSESNLLATASLRITFLKVSLLLPPIRIGMIGAVATKSEFQKQGMARRLVEKLLQIAKVSEVTFVMVWGSEHSFYEKLGFGLAGEQWLIRVSDVKKGVFVKDSRIEIGWNAEIFELRRKCLFGLDLQDRDREWFKAHLNVKWYSLVREEKRVAYLGLGRGIDLTQIVHEWGGPMSDLIHLMNRVAHDHPGATLIGPPETLRECMGPAAEFNREFLGLAKILNPEDLFPKTHSVRFEWSEDKQQWKIISGLKEESVSSTKLSPLLLGDPFRTEVNNEDPLQSVPVWLWGLDSA